MIVKHPVDIYPDYQLWTVHETVVTHGQLSTCLLLVVISGAAPNFFELQISNFNDYLNYY